MHPAQHRYYVRIGLLGALAIVAVTGCTMLGDVTGVAFQRSNPSDCIKACVNGQDDLLKAEIQLHQANLEACQSLHGRAQADCLDAEATRHAAAMAQIAQSRQECMNGCHRQGSGSAG